MSPLAWLVLIIKGQVGLLTLAMGVLWLARRKAGAWDIKDWLVFFGASISVVADFVAVADLEAHYIDTVGSAGTGVLARKWIVEGDDSTTFKVAVQFRGWEDDYSVGEGFWDSMTPPKNVPVMYDPEYPSDFVPKFRVEAAWDPLLVGGLLAAAAVLELAVFGWVGVRVVERFRGYST